MTDAFVTGLRAEIDAGDRELLAVVNRRLETVRRLHDYKLERGIPLRDPGREESLLEMLAAANPGPLSVAGLADLFHHVLELTRRELHGD